jgi:outer membrane protein
MSTFNRSIAFLALSLCGFLAAQQASADTKIGVVNFQKLLEDAPQTKSAMAALENEFAPRRRELMTMQTDLKAHDEKLQREGAVMAEADRVKAEKTLRDEQREFSRKASEFQDDVSTRRNEELGKVQRYLVGEVQSYSGTQGFDLVVAGSPAGNTGACRRAAKTGTRKEIGIYGDSLPIRVPVCRPANTALVSLR